MAFFHMRKLFPYLTSTSNYTHAPCPDVCDPTCATNFHDCYSFPHPDPDPDPYWVVPLPLPPPLPPSPHDVAGYQIYPLVIIVIIVLATAFLLVTYYAVVVKHCSTWTRLLIRGNPDPPEPGSQADRHGTDDFFHNMAGHQDPMVDHPIWLISTIGLQQSVINSITVIRFKRGDGLIEGTDCSVCLNEFQQGETLRLLPKCNHAFHMDCIDTWLTSHTNCPLCRSPVVVNSGRPSLASNEPSLRLEDSDSSDLELGISTQTGTGSGTPQNRCGIGQFNYEVDNNTYQNKDEDYVVINQVPLLIQVRRSFSMDLRGRSNSRNVGYPNPQRNPILNPFRWTGSPSSSRQQPATAAEAPAPMKKSYSWSERVFWSTCNQKYPNSGLSP